MEAHHSAFLSSEGYVFRRATPLALVYGGSILVVKCTLIAQQSEETSGEVTGKSTPYCSLGLQRILTQRLVLHGATALYFGI